MDTEPQPATPLPSDSHTDWSTIPDFQLIEACLGGEEAAWSALLARYGRLIYTIPLRFGFSKTVADEVFQETCLILLEGLNGLEDRHRLSSWLMTVTRRACLQRIHRPAAPDADPLPDTLHAVTPTIEEQLQQLEQQYLVQTALNRLPERDQQLLRALFFEEPRRPYEEIARDLGISAGSIGPLRARGLKRLHQEMVRLERP
ncbi:MAG: sigma-70 family RNA polymerase sigma factor [Anaerolineae bacterium]|nr:sigma-70 family RNA polymerase sigma factor [Anaerolineae bacterium]